MIAPDFFFIMTQHITSGRTSAVRPGYHKNEAIRKVSGNDELNASRVNLLQSDQALFFVRRVARYLADRSATRLPATFFPGSKTTRTCAFNTRATRRSMLREWPS